MKAYGGRRLATPLTQNPCTNGHFGFQAALPPWKECPVLIKWGAAWAPEKFYMFLETGKCLLLQPGVEPRLLSLEARSLPIPTTLCQLLRIGMAITERVHRSVKGIGVYNNQTLASFSSVANIFS